MIASKYIPLSLLAGVLMSTALITPTVAEPPPAGDSPETRMLALMRSYLAIIREFHEVGDDPALAGTAAVLATSDILEQRGQPAVIEHYEKLLPEVKDPTIRRVVQLRLADAYKNSAQPDKALSVLRQLITADSAAK